MDVEIHHLVVAESMVNVESTATLDNCLPGQAVDDTHTVLDGKQIYGLESEDRWGIVGSCTSDPLEESAVGGNRASFEVEDQSMSNASVNEGSEVTGKSALDEASA